jgi:hypothetical protein
MPSPFPGMDPYLENPLLWPDVHNSLIVYMKAKLNACLPAGYAAHIDERVYLVEPDRNIYPDVAIVGQLSRLSPEKKQAESAVAIHSDPGFEILEEPSRVREAFINIVRKGEPGRVVGTIELFSPSNKDSGNPGRELYLKKQEQTLASNTHLVEIDVLREGEHTVAASKRMLEEAGPWDYVACLHRAGRGRRFTTWPVTVRQRLPRILIPLAEGDPDVVLDLQAVFQRCYDECGYVRDLNYTQEPAVPLKDSDAAWADKLLRRQGLRKKKRKAR